MHPKQTYKPKKGEKEIDRERRERLLATLLSSNGFIPPTTILRKEFKITSAAAKVEFQWLQRKMRRALWSRQSIFSKYNRNEKTKLSQMFSISIPQGTLNDENVSAVSSNRVLMSSNRVLADAPTQRSSSEDDVSSVNSNASDRNRVIVQQEQELALNREIIVQLEKQIEEMRLNGARKLPSMKTNEFFGEIRSFFRNNIPKKVVEETDKAMCIRREATSQYSKINSITFELMMDTINWSVRLTVEGAKKNRLSSGNPKRSIFSLLASYVSLLQRLQLNVDDNKYKYASNRKMQDDIQMEYDYTTLLHAYKIITELPEQ
ncbi:unnamed protein product [Caenorhabditis brenneri]